jgi:hypothetical protein
VVSFISCLIDIEISRTVHGRSHLIASVDAGFGQSEIGPALPGVARRTLHQDHQRDRQERHEHHEFEIVDECENLRTVKIRNSVAAKAGQPGTKKLIAINDEGTWGS